VLILVLLIDEYAVNMLIFICVSTFRYSLHYSWCRATEVARISYNVC
jgi:hypothetical protein